MPLPLAVPGHAGRPSLLARVDVHVCALSPLEEATWEPFSAFVLPEGRLNLILVDYLSQNNLGELLRLAETLASKTKARA